MVEVLPVSVPDEHGSPYKSPSAFAVSPALLEHPDAPVSPEELARFAEREQYWVDSWTAFGGDLADQVRFAREWTELRAYAADRGVRIMGDVPIYVAPDGADVRAWPSLFRSDAVAGVRPDLGDRDPRTVRPVRRGAADRLGVRPAVRGHRREAAHRVRADPRGDHGVADGVGVIVALGFVAGASPPVGPLGDQSRTDRKSVV